MRQSVLPLLGDIRLLQLLKRGRVLRGRLCGSRERDHKLPDARDVHHVVNESLPARFGVLVFHLQHRKVESSGALHRRVPHRSGVRDARAQRRTQRLRGHLRNERRIRSSDPTRVESDDALANVVHSEALRAHRVRAFPQADGLTVRGVRRVVVEPHRPIAVRAQPLQVAQRPAKNREALRCGPRCRLGRGLERVDVLQELLRRVRLEQRHVQTRHDGGERAVRHEVVRRPFVHHLV